MKGGRDEIEQLRQLIEIQSQIVELARQNELTAKECEELRERLACEARQRARRSRFPGGVHRLGRRFVAAVAALGALLLPPRPGN
jgi:hypothetical protein